MRSLIFIFLFILSQIATAQSILKTRRVHDGNKTRTYRVYLPQDFRNRKTPAKVVMGFHPASPKATVFESTAQLHKQSGADDAVVVYPQADLALTGNLAWNVGFCCSGADDLAFYDAIMDDLNKLTNIESKVAITGWSSGAMMVYHLACERSDEISSAVAYGAYLREQDISTKGACPWSKPFPFMHIHGVEDAQMKIDGQAHAYYPRSGHATLPLTEYMNIVASRNGGISSKAQVYDFGGGVEAVVVNGLTSYVTIEGLGHIWPGALATGQYGPSRTDIDASAFIMALLLGS